MPNHIYHNQQNYQQMIKLKSIMHDLPGFTEQFFIGIEHHTQPGTRLRYATDLKLFFKYLYDQNPDKYDSINNMSIDILNDLSPFEIEKFLSYIKVYTNEKGQIRKNGRNGIKSKLAAIRSLYSYFFKHGQVKANVAQLIDMPIIEDKNIVRLSNTQIDQVLDNIINGTYLDGRERIWNKLYKTRDYAIIVLLLGTGIRVSECVGIDLTDVNFSEFSIQIIRKGGNEDMIYFSDEVCAALKDYYAERIMIEPKNPDEAAFFLSKSRTRLSVRSIQELVQKYTRNIKQVSPHKLRATFGTNLYVATKDIYLVADTLGHTNVETTRKHYAEIPEQEKRNARNALKIDKKRGMFK